MNRGDAGHLYLNIKINNQPMPKDFAREIEVTFSSSTNNTIIKTLSKGDITWEVDPQDPTKGMYRVFLSQSDTFKLAVGNNAWQIRLLRNASGDSGDVISSRVGALVIGPSISDNVLKFEQ